MYAPLRLWLLFRVPSGRRPGPAPSVCRRVSAASQRRARRREPKRTEAAEDWRVLMQRIRGWLVWKCGFDDARELGMGPYWDVVAPSDWAEIGINIVRKPISASRSVLVCVVGEWRRLCLLHLYAPFSFVPQKKPMLLFSLYKKLYSFYMWCKNMKTSRILVVWTCLYNAS